MKKLDLIFILSSASLLILAHYLGILEKLSAFFLIPLLISYQLGKYAQRKTSK